VVYPVCACVCVCVCEWECVFYTDKISLPGTVYSGISSVCLCVCVRACSRVCVSVSVSVHMYTVAYHIHSGISVCLCLYICIQWYIDICSGILGQDICMYIMWTGGQAAGKCAYQVDRRAQVRAPLNILQSTTSSQVSCPLIIVKSTCECLSSAR